MGQANSRLAVAPGHAHARVEPPENRAQCGLWERRPVPLRRPRLRDQQGQEREEQGAGRSVGQVRGKPSGGGILAHSEQIGGPPAVHHLHRRLRQAELSANPDLFVCNSEKAKDRQRQQHDLQRDKDKPGEQDHDPGLQSLSREP